MLLYSSRVFVRRFPELEDCPDEELVVSGSWWKRKKGVILRLFSHTNSAPAWRRVPKEDARGRE
jgi:hypothetical protein